jgi:hypothetical protein
MWDLWWTKWGWVSYSPSTSVSPTNLQSTSYSIITIIYHLGLVKSVVAAVPSEVTQSHSTKKNNTAGITGRSLTWRPVLLKGLCRPKIYFATPVFQWCRPVWALNRLEFNVGEINTEIGNYSVCVYVCVYTYIYMFNIRKCM